MDNPNRIVTDNQLSELASDVAYRLQDLLDLIVANRAKLATQERPYEQLHDDYLRRVAVQRGEDETIPVTLAELKTRVAKRAPALSAPYGFADNPTLKLATPQSARGWEWVAFANLVLQHIETYTVPQYGDAPTDQVESWNVEQCVAQIGKYAARFGTNSRPNQEALDLFKIAHYAALAYGKHLRKATKQLSEQSQAVELGVSSENRIRFYSPTDENPSTTGLGALPEAVPPQRQLSFSEALAAIQQGRTATRQGWSNNHAFVLLVKGKSITETINDTYGDPDRHKVDACGYELGETIPVCDALYIRHKWGFTPWIPTQEDLLAKDWSLT